MRLTLALLPLLACCAASGPALSQTSPDKPAVHTNFSGRWRMDKEKSDFGKFRRPDIVVRAIDQRDPDMNVHLVQTTGEHTTTVDTTYKTDGSPCNNVINGRDAISKSFWDGGDLVIRTTMKNSKNEDEVIEDRYALSADGKTLTTTSHVVTEKGEATLVMVSDKQAVNP